ncbi:MAG: CbiX/SirB N-terminal domain-containing protein [Chlorobium sp.]|uniref:sirohydrochlorin chelatase n=1 Tax=Chlorobium sp. TaxID=1095 RepID=UPI002F3FCD15
MNRISRSGLFLLVFLLATALQSCSSESRRIPFSAENESKKTGVLLVSHGSPSKTWRDALFELEKSVTSEIMADGKVSGIKTAFMEYTEPSIATRLKEFDKEGYSDVVVVPVFLTVSPHSFDDLPTIMGQKEDPRSMETLKLEKIERYKPDAAIHMTPLLDFGEALQQNVVRRVKALSKKPSQEGLVLIGYGDEAYEKEWNDLFDKVGASVKKETGVDAYAHAWCGHIVRYRSDSTTVAVKRMLKRKQHAVVIPVLVAHDENFQIRIIGSGLEKASAEKSRILYKPDALLPDPSIEQWIVNAVKTALADISSSKK